MILWSCNHTSRFPRNHPLLGERIERNLYDLLETLIRAKYARQRQVLLEQANLTLEIFRFQMLLAVMPIAIGLAWYQFRRSSSLLDLGIATFMTSMLPHRQNGLAEAWGILLQGRH